MLNSSHIEQEIINPEINLTEDIHAIEESINLLKNHIITIKQNISINNLESFDPLLKEIFDNICIIENFIPDKAQNALATNSHSHLLHVLAHIDTLVKLFVKHKDINYLTQEGFIGDMEENSAYLKECINNKSFFNSEISQEKIAKHLIM